jgi:hypothetical protein
VHTTTKWRSKLLWFFIAMAALDSCGKSIEHDQRTLDRVHGAVDRFGIHLPARAARRTINFDIFRYSSRHLMAGVNLYAAYPAEHSDRYKYSPMFALLFTPFAYLPWALSLFLWQLLNALLLFYALTRVLEGKVADLAIGLVSLEVWRSMQNSQSNALVAATIVLALVALEERKHLAAATWIVVGTIVKIFPVIAGVFALPTRQRWRVAALTALVLVVVALLPAFVTGPAQLWEQYRSWFVLERVDHTAYEQSMMAMLHMIPGVPAMPNIVIELVGFGVLVLPLLLRPRGWSDRQFRLNMLASVLLYVVLFNPQAERASYVIAFTGIAIWYASTPRTMTDHVLFGFAFVAITISSLLVPGKWIRSPVVIVVRLVVPCVLIWIRLQLLMLQSTEARGVPQGARAWHRRTLGTSG